MSSIIIKKTVECEECEAEYKVRHDMSDRHYVVSFCSFCGAELEIEASLDDFINEDENGKEIWGIGGEFEYNNKRRK